LDALQGEPSGSVSIAALPSAAEFLIPPTLIRLGGHGVSITLTDDDVAEADFGSRTADHDLVIGHTLAGAPAGAEQVSARTLAREPLDVAVPSGHRLASLAAIAAQDLAGEPWIGVPLGYPFDTVRIAIENRCGGRLQVVQRVRDNRVVEALVAAGVGCALLPRFTTRVRDGMVTRPLSDVRSVRSIVALGRPDRLERAVVGLVLDTLAEVGAEISARAG
jgi:DNA-binding transcriptional LysR family regulator